MELTKKCEAPFEPTASKPKKNGRRFVYFKNNWHKYLMLAIPVVMVLVFCYFPMYGILIAFQKYNIMKGVWASSWVGLDNFKAAFSLPRFWHVVGNTIRLGVLSLLIGFPMPILLAILINEIRHQKVVKFIQTFSYLPHFLSIAIVGGIVYNLCAPDTGIFNQILKAFGQGNIPFLTDSTWWIVTYLAAEIWQTTGWGSIIYIAAITTINPELYEAGIVDGCNRLQKIRYITLPSIKPTIVLMLILRMGDVINASFDRSFVLGNSIVSDVSEVISVYVYNVGLGQGSFDLATVVGLFQSVVSLVLVLIVNAIAKAVGEEGLW